MKLTKIALGVTLGLGGLAVNAADVAMFPYVVSSSTVTTIISIIDTGDANTVRYNSSGITGTLSASGAFNRLHWRLNYKAGDDATNNAASCDELDYYLPTSPNDIQSVDLGGTLANSGDRGVLFNDPSNNNNWRTGLGSSLTYAMTQQAGNPVRGVLFVNNADNTTVDYTVQGEAMVFEFQSGAAWGYAALPRDNGSANDASAFDYANTSVLEDFRSSVNGNIGVTFQPLAETTTVLLVTPLDDIPGGTGNYAGTGAGTSPQTMLGVNGGSINGWNILTTDVSLYSGAGGAFGVAFDRDENLVSGALPATITCVGATTVSQLMTSGAQTVLADGGYGTVRTTQPSAASTRATVPGASIIKLEYSTGGVFNGNPANGVFNNAFLLP